MIATSIGRIAFSRLLVAQEGVGVDQPTDGVHQDLVDLDVEGRGALPVRTFRFASLGASPRSVADDAWYLALTERLEVALVTLDRRLTRTANARCEFTFPPLDHGAAAIDRGRSTPSPTKVNPAGI